MLVLGPERCTVLKLAMLLILLVLRCSGRVGSVLVLVLVELVFVLMFVGEPLCISLWLTNDRGRTAGWGSSVVLPLPVEFVAGGEGSPDPLELAPGLGGSGRSGICGGW